MSQLFFNNARGVLAESVSTGNTLIKIKDHANIPTSLASGDYFLLTLFRDTTRYGENIEVVKVTAITAGTNGQLNLTVERGYEFPAQIHTAGARLEARLTAQSLRDLLSEAKSFTQGEVAALLDAAPGALDTLNELAAALGDDPNFAATMTAELAKKLDKTSYTAADVLAKLLTVDGANSGLDADKLDGKQLATIESEYKAYADQSEADAKTHANTGLATKLDKTAYTADDVLAKVKSVDGTDSGLDADTLDGKQLATIEQEYTAADQDHVNTLNPHPQYALVEDDSATLDWNFATGKYARDNGERVETTNLGELATVTRPDTKQVFGPNGFQRTAIAGAVARQWNPVTGEAEGVVQEKASKNLLKASEAIGSGVWNINSNNTKCSASVKKSPDGAYTATRISKSGAYAYLGQNFNGETGQTLCLSVYAHAGSLNSVTLLLSGNVGTGGALEGRLRFDFDTTTINDADSRALVDSGMEDVGDGWFRVWLSATLQTGQNPSVFLYPGLYNDPAPGDAYFWGAQLEKGDKPTSYIPTPATFTSRASTGTYFDSNGVLQTAAIDEPRENHVLVDGEWVSQGLLIEPEAATNLVPNTLLTDPPTSTQGNVTITTGESDPFGGNRGVRIQVTASSGSRHVNFYNLGDSTEYQTSSCWAKVNAGDMGETVLKNRAPSDVPFSGDWGFYTLTDSSNGFRYFGVQSTSDIDVTVCLPQVETGLVATSFIPTTDSPVTRAADVVSSVEVERGQDDLSAPLTEEYNPRQGTWVIDAEHNDVAPLTGIGLDGAYTSGKGKLVYSYDESGGEAFANGAKVFDTPPVKKAQTVGLGHQTTGRVQYFPKKLPVAQAIARATGSVAVDYPFADGRSFYTDFNANDYGVQNYQNAVETLRTDDPGEVLTVERNSPTWVLESDGVYRQVASNVLAREWNPTTGKYAAQISGAVTNELLWSTDFSNAAWNKVRTTISQDAEMALDGTVSADKFVEDTSASATHFVGQSYNVDLDVLHTYSIFIKAGERDRVDLVAENLTNTTGGTQTIGQGFDLASGSIVAPSVGLIVLPVDAHIEAHNDGWYRCSIVGYGRGVSGEIKVYLTSGGSPVYTGDGTSGVYLWQAQLVQGTTPGPLIVTEDAPVTRDADLPKRMLGDEFDQSNFTLVVDFYPEYFGDTNHRYLSFQNTLSNRLTVGFSNDTTLVVYYGVGGVYTNPLMYLPSGQTVHPSQRIRLAISKNATNVKAVANGGAVGTATAAEDWSVKIADFLLGRETFSTLGGGKFSETTLYPYAMTDTQLQELTTL